MDNNYEEKIRIPVRSEDIKSDRGFRADLIMELNGLSMAYRICHFGAYVFLCAFCGFARDRPEALPYFKRVLGKFVFSTVLWGI